MTSSGSQCASTRYRQKPPSSAACQVNLCMCARARACMCTPKDVHTATLDENVSSGICSRGEGRRSRLPRTENQCQYSAGAGGPERERRRRRRRRGRERGERARWWTRGKTQRGGILIRTFQTARAAHHPRALMRDDYYSRARLKRIGRKLFNAPRYVIRRRRPTGVDRRIKSIPAPLPPSPRG